VFVRSGIAVLAAALLVSGSLAAQADQFQSINYGETLAAYLTTSDDTLGDGSYFKGFVFDAQMADTVTISLISDDFDAVILIADSAGEFLSSGGSDNNSAGQCNAQLTLEIPVAGSYLILATTNYAGEKGEFQLSLVRGVRSPPSSEPCRGFFETKGALSLGDSIRGELGPPGDSKLGPSYFQVWELEIPYGQTVTVDLVSDAFDARLRLYRGFRTAVDANDDGAGQCNARLVLTGGAHPYRIVMTTGKEEETGEYLLAMVNGALPVTAESQCSQ
jgi:serine protease Do